MKPKAYNGLLNHGEQAQGGEIAGREAVAIVGIGCRFPGGIEDPASYWELLMRGEDAIVDVPTDRWDIRRFYDPDRDKPGKMYVRAGGFLREPIDQFDAMFFGITPREADCLDPQQRLLMEVTWEALEDAGIPAEKLAGSDTGVFIGAFTLDNKLTQMTGANRNLIGPHTAVGSTMTMLSNRLSYFFDFRGPSISMDTACSSSLVAFHYACEAVRNGDCGLALAGGVNIIHRPEYMIAMCKGQFLAADGHCKSFDARGDGYARGEGAGALVLKRLSEALRDGDPIYATVRGTGVNQDGRTSGITVPNADSQQALARQVCRTAGVDPKDIGYVEAHGTGTAVGDPSEAHALGEALGQGRNAENACIVGSVKANIGHLEAASGMAGVIKAALCLKHKQIPPQANLETPNPNIPFDALGLRLPRHAEPLPVLNGRAYAAVNSFGYGGTNAHALLEESPAEGDDFDGTLQGESQAQEGPWLLPLSARSEDALKAMVRGYSRLLSDDSTPNPKDLCYSASLKRTHHDHRLAVSFESVAHLNELLDLYMQDDKSDCLESGKVSGKEAPRPVFVFTGMGPQWWAMGHELLRTNGVFRDTAEACDRIFRRLAGWSILEEMFADEAYSRISTTQVAQPANFVLQAGLYAVWRSWGMEPAAIVGHSVGEVTAAYAAGVLTLEEAVSVSYHRGRVQSQAAGKGRMLAVGLTERECDALLESHRESVSIAAVNSQSTVTLAGDSEVLEELASKLEAAGVFNRFLKVEVPYHSPAMEPLKPELRSVLGGLAPRLPEIPLYSTVSGDQVTQISYDAEYWCNNVRHPVRFAKAMSSLLRDGYRVFLEVGPHPVLSTAIKECMMVSGVRGPVLASLRRQEPERLALLKALGGLYASGYAPEWDRLYPDKGRYIPLPRYPWQRQTYWIESQEALDDRFGQASHPLLDHRVASPEPTWESPLNPQLLPYLEDHGVDGVVVLPGAAYVESGLALARSMLQNDAQTLIGLTFHNALVIDPLDEPVLRVQYREESGGFSIHSRTRDAREHWTLHATGTVWDGKQPERCTLSPEELKADCSQSVDVDQLYRQLAERGLNYGPWFRGIQRLWTGDDEVLAEIAVHPSFGAEPQEYRLHPTVLDSCFQALICLLKGGDDKAYLPVEIERITLHQTPAGRCWMHGRLTERSERSIRGDLVLLDETGSVFARLTGLRCQALSTRQHQNNSSDQWLYRWAWRQAEPESVRRLTGRWVVFDDGSPLADELVGRLESAVFAPVVRVLPGDIFQQETALRFRVKGDERAELERLFEAIGECDGIAYLWGDEPAEAGDIATQAMEHACRFVNLCQGLESRQVTRSPRMFVITRGVQSVLPGEPNDGLVHAPLVGVARVAFNEQPENRCTLVDIDRDETRVSVAALLQELLADSAEDDIGLRGGERFLHRLERAPMDSLRKDSLSRKTMTASSGPAYAARVDRWNDGRVIWEQSVHRAPDPGQIEIEVLAAALRPNDRGDLLPAGSDGTVFAPGRERGAIRGLTGIVRRTGKGVDALSPGDTVVAFAPAGLSAYVTLPAAALTAVSLGNDLDVTQAAALPLDFTPAFHALSHIARVERGTTVLVRGDGSGTALAAVNIARWLGAQVFCPPEVAVEACDAAAVGSVTPIDPGTVDFIDRAREATDGRGFDVVLNIGARQLPGSTTSILAPFGHLIDIFDSRTDQNADAALPAGRGNFAYTALDVERMATERPALLRSTLARATEIVRARALTSNSVEVFGCLHVNEALEAVEHPSRSRAVVLTFGDALAPQVYSRPEPKPLITDGGTYLITGGFGGFGAEIARWLVGQGACHLALLGRRGAESPGAAELLAELKERGARVLSLAADITDAAQVRNAVDSIGAEMPPLYAVFHSAAVLDDAPLTALDAGRMQRVMAPKVEGAWNLHRATRDLNLRHFVMFSSVSGLIGNARQGNYVAGNVFLDVLAHHRRASGLSAVSINWGAISGAGMAADSDDVARHLELMGMRSFSAQTAMEALARVAPVAPPQLGIMDVSWEHWARFEPTGGASPRFAHLVEAETGPQASGAADGLRDQLLAAEPEDRHELTALLLAEQVSETLRLPSERIDLHVPLPDMGMDSLLGVELQTGLNLRFGVELSTLELIKGNSIMQIADIVLRKLKLDAEQTAPDDVSPVSVPVDADSVDQLSDEALEQLLGSMLAREGN